MNIEVNAPKVDVNIPNPSMQTGFGNPVARSYMHDVFWITYGTTTPDEMDAAIEAGNLLVCNRGNRVYPFRSKTTLVGGDILYYFVYETVSSDGAATYYVQCRKTSNSFIWSQGGDNFHAKLPSGGEPGQFLVKTTYENYDVDWVTVPEASGVSF